MALLRIKQNQLRERVLKLIAEEFGELDRASVARVLAQLSRNYDQDIHLSMASEISHSESNHASAILADSAPSVSSPKEAGDDSSFGVVEGGSRIRLVAEDEDHIHDLLNQIVAVGAVLIHVNRDVQLNDLIALHIELVPLQFTVDFVGRVVNISVSGTAIEVSQITSEDRAALELSLIHI